MRLHTWLGIALLGTAWLVADRVQSSAAIPEPPAAAPTRRDTHELTELIRHLPVAPRPLVERPTIAPVDDEPAVRDIDDFLEDVEVIGHFGAVYAHADAPRDPPEVVSLSSACTIENTYVVDADADESSMDVDF